MCIQGDNLCTMFHSVCCLFHAKSCCLSDREKSSALLTISVAMYVLTSAAKVCNCVFYFSHGVDKYVKGLFNCGFAKLNSLCLFRRYLALS